MAGPISQEEQNRLDDIKDERRRMPIWQQNYLAGTDAGKDEFYDDPDMVAMRKRREDLSNGYSGSEMGALRGSARHEIQGQRQGYLNQLRSGLARGGVGGALGAAMQGAANQKFAQTSADAERKMLLDSANMKRQGATDLQDFLFRQKYGKLATGISYGQMALAEQQLNDARAAAKKGGGKSGMFTSGDEDTDTFINPYLSSFNNMFGQG